jgi:hypothetical protein
MKDGFNIKGGRADGHAGHGLGDWMKRRSTGWSTAARGGVEGVFVLARRAKARMCQKNSAVNLSGGPQKAKAAA